MLHALAYPEMKSKKIKRIILDYASITPLDKKVAKEMLKVQNKFWANPSSLNKEGEEAKNVLGKARKDIAHILQCCSSEIIFTSGGTESCNLAILGILQAENQRQSFKKSKSDFELPRSQKSDLDFLSHIIVSSIEHPAILEPIKFLLKNKKIEVSFIVPDEEGLINPESIRKELKENTVLVAIQHANNEIGTIQPIHC